MDKTLTEVIFGTPHLNRLKAGLETAAAATEQWLQSLCEVFLIREMWDTLFFSSDGLVLADIWRREACRV